MKKKQNKSVAASAFHITLALALASGFAILCASTFRAAPMSRSQVGTVQAASPNFAPAPMSPADCIPSYTLALGGAPFVPGDTDIGNHCDNCGTAITLPFPVTLYDQTFTTASAGSNPQLPFATPYHHTGTNLAPTTTATTT